MSSPGFDGFIKIPSVPLNFVPAKSGEIIKLGQITCRILEDGSRTDNRLGTCELILPPKTPGPPPHWHEMHDETFLITAGTIRFHYPDPLQPGVDLSTTDAHAGDYMTVPVRSPHTFSNPGDVEARLFFTTTPAFYVNYFRLLADMGKEFAGKPMPAEANVKAMALYGTTLVDRVPRKPE
nr:hypothetical protein B0A51_16144 [Rachicladosporium sp. CCFEE 5018]